MKKIFSIVLSILICFIFVFRANSMDLTVDLDNSNSFISQTMVGSLVTQAIREVSGADVAFICSSGIKGMLRKGSLNISILKDVLYYPDDRVVILELTGQQIKSVMERSVGTYPGESSNFLQASGITGTFEPSFPSGNRIVNLYIGGNPVDGNRRYKVALDETLAGGFSGYTIFTQGKLIQTSITLGQVLEKFSISHNVFGMPEDSGLKPVK